MADSARDSMVVGSVDEDVYSALTPPIYLSTTFVHDDVGRHRGFAYSRAGNPTRPRLEVTAELEQAEFGFAFASGLAAPATVCRRTRLFRWSSRSAPSRA